MMLPFTSPPDALPASVTESFCGAGNPLSLGELAPCQAILDPGCGAGLGTLPAARRVDTMGRVIGADMPPEKIAKARRNAEGLGLRDVEFLLLSLALIGQMPLHPEQSKGDALASATTYRTHITVMCSAQHETGGAPVMPSHS